MRPFAYGSASDAPPVEAPNSLIDEIESIPVVLAVAADLNLIALMDGNLDRPAITGGASIYPFCWSILLAARAHDLGGVLTTFLVAGRTGGRCGARPASRPRSRQRSSSACRLTRTPG